MEIEMEIGQGQASDGTTRPLRGTRTQSAAVAQAHGKYYDAVMRGNCFHGAQQAAAALGTALTATAVTLTLYNPPGTGKGLVIMQTTLAIPVGTTAGQVVYGVNDTSGQAVPATTTDLASGIKNCLLGMGNASIARLFSAATLPAAPRVARVLAGIISTTPGGIHTIVDEVDGAIIVAPGAMLTIQGITTNATGQIGLMWEEVAL